MTDVLDLSMRLSEARKQIKKAHRVPEKWTEEMELTDEAIGSLGIQHYGQAGENMPERIIKAQVRAMADLTFAYGEQAYEAKDGELSFFDDGQRDEFHEHLDLSKHTVRNHIEAAKNRYQKAKATKGKMFNL